MRSWDVGVENGWKSECVWVKTCMQNTLSPSLRAARVQAFTVPYYAVAARSSQISCLQSHGPARICCTALRTGLGEGWPTCRHGRPASRPAQRTGPCYGLLRKATLLLDTRGVGHRRWRLPHYPSRGTTWRGL
jgi:hypothetical protein